LKSASRGNALSELYPSQTKILEGLTKGEIKIFDIPFKGVSTRFGLQTIEKYIENLDFIFCQSFQNLRLNVCNMITKDSSNPCSEQKIAQFRTHYFTKELAYVSTQQSGQLDTFLLNHFSVY